MPEKRVVVIGSGVAGLSAALELSSRFVQVDIIEKSGFAGGHAVRFACKATKADGCVSCGACVVEDKLENVLKSNRIRLHKGSEITDVQRSDGRFRLDIVQNPEYIDSGACDGCGICVKHCSDPDAISRGTSALHHPFFVIDPEKWEKMGEDARRRCGESCPQNAIDWKKNNTRFSLEADAVVPATGFTPFWPVDKPYGYGVFPNVIRNIDLEDIFRRNGRVLKPSDGNPPERMAFIQCVGSRDASLSHLWCSRICCGSALRAARLIRERQPEIRITIFYIDFQTVGSDFDSFLTRARADYEMIRTIPGDIYQEADGKLRIGCFRENTHEIVDERFDMVVLSVAMTPNMDNMSLMKGLGLAPAPCGFFHDQERENMERASGIFPAGAMTGPMSIPESVASAGVAVRKTLEYLGI